MWSWLCDRGKLGIQNSLYIKPRSPSTESGAFVSFDKDLSYSLAIILKVAGYLAVEDDGKPEMESPGRTPCLRNQPCATSSA